MKTYIIYLAAGNSRRFKEDKLHTLFKGKELYLYGIDTLKQLLKHRNDIEIIIVSNTIDIQEKYIHSYKSPLSCFRTYQSTKRLSNDVYGCRSTLSFLSNT